MLAKERRPDKWPSCSLAPLLKKYMLLHTCKGILVLGLLFWQSVLHPGAASRDKGDSIINAMVPH
jgi:hypothetical protein